MILDTNTVAQVVIHDVTHTPGLVRMGKAKDDSWEVQVYNCGQLPSAVAARIGNMTVEVVAQAVNAYNRTPVTGASKIYVNGQERTDFPIKLPDGTMLYQEHRAGYYAWGRYGNGETYEPDGSWTNYKIVRRWSLH